MKNNINLAGSLFQFLWHFFSITARVLALSLFASIYPRVIGPVCIAHWLIMATWVMCQKTQACNSACEEFLFNIVLGAVYIFSFFNAKEGRTRYKYALYYSFCFVENTVLIVFWFLYANSGLLPGQTHWYWIPGIIGHYVMFFGGILFMVIYYTCFHPTGIDMPRILKVRGRQNVAHSRSSPRAERPTFLDLREMPGKGKGDEELSSASLAAGGCNLRPGSRTSQSTPTLDEIDSGARIVARGGGEEDGRAGHNSVRKTSSAPTGDLRSAMSAVRSLKYMRNDRTKC